MSCDRIGPDNAAHLGQLPMLLRGLYYEGWHPSGKPTKERHAAEVLARVRELLPRADRAGIHAVFDLLSKKIDRGEAVKLAGILPTELRDFWPTFVQTAAQTKNRCLLIMLAAARA